MEVVKEYNYKINGRNVCIKRNYTVKGIRSKKINELDEYFKNNYEAVKESKKLKDVFESYNNAHDDKISFSMLYQKYISVFGRRKKPTETVNKAVNKAVNKTVNKAVNKTDNSADNSAENTENSL